MLYFLLLKRYPVDGLLVCALERVLRVLEKCETSAVEAPARDSRARGLGPKEKPIWRQIKLKTCDTSVVKLDPE